jgi:hypothetical protein
MTDAETLQKLFELAWERGAKTLHYISEYEGLGQWARIENDWLLIGSDGGRSNIYQLFFDRSPTALIPSLCRSSDNHLDDTQVALLLMPEPDRIPWLGRVFLKECKGRDDSEMDKTE